MLLGLARSPRHADMWSYPVDERRTLLCQSSVERFSSPHTYLFEDSRRARYPPGASTRLYTLALWTSRRRRVRCRIDALRVSCDEGDGMCLMVWGVPKDRMAAVHLRVCRTVGRVCGHRGYQPWGTGQNLNVELTDLIRQHLPSICRALQANPPEYDSAQTSAQYDGHSSGP